ncbi:MULTISPECIES: type I restriction-modification system endonuclease [Bacillus cereus group]|uniref:type I restriction-modification system endonuclease n=1 Tax=Bacillus cereus group TaxID=86661 RepID=UPI000BFB4D62|nr:MULTISPECIES: type I restriction-modification system endonuclease [Bacillus cereus group]PGT15362.1 type I restriction-modification system endonuclease [Bacillus cereus]
MSNFEMLVKTWPLFAQLGKQAEENIYRDPNVSIIKLRLFAEKMTEALFTLERSTFWNLNGQVDKLRELERMGVLEDEITTIFHTIRKTGNKAAHNNYGNTTEAMTLIRYAHYLSNWFMEVYGSLDFKPTEFIEPKDIDKARTDELAKLKAQVELVESEKLAFKAQLEEIEKQAELQPEEVREERRERSKAFLRNTQLTEKQTRLMFIDEQLRDAGWEVDTESLDWRKGARPEKNKNKAISEVPTKSGRADYALFIGLQLVGVIEAKKYGKDAAGDMLQAKEYSRDVKDTGEFDVQGVYGDYQAPFIYSTNGRPYLKQLADQSGIWFWDARTPNKSSFALESWHSPDDLKQKLIVDEKRAEDELKKEEYPDFANRHYQISAVKAVEQGLAENKRRMLLAMATGTGKTRLALSLMYRLIKTKRIRRVLFLVDRRSLGTQAADALKDTKIENLSFADIYDVKEVTDVLPEKDTKIHIATVQGMVRRLFYKDNVDEIPSVGTYDFIIVDEAHRGYTEDKEMSEDELYFQNEKDYVSQYRRVIDYFDATVLGLTATPALHTTQIFGAPIYTYSYTDAVVDGYLVDHEPPYTFETELSTNGIKFEAGSDVDVWNEETKMIDKAHLKDELDFDVEQFNKKVITENFNRVILEGLTEHIDPNEPGKTLIFAANDKHADLIVRLLKEAYEKADMPVDDDAIEKITGYIRHPDKEIKRFKNEKYPNIVVTVDLLTTGIDVPKIENLVFLRRVRSRILYDQMLGRATRLCPEIGKYAFKIFDAVHLYDYLQNVTDMKPVVSNPKQTIQEILDKAIQAEDAEEFGFFKAELMGKLQRKKQRLSEESQREIQTLNAVNDLDKWIQNIKMLSREELESQSENIQRIGMYYETPNPIYISVKEDKLLDISRGYGEGNVKPGDYLNDFNQFIRENINLIPALQMVVSRPKDLTYQDLREIQLRLKEKKFDEKALQEAWRQEKKEYIAADIISFIRQAVLGTALVDHETRIKNAMQKVYGMESWTPRQKKWLERIEKQLLTTSVLAPTAKKYFDETEVWKQQGGYKAALRQIGESVDSIIEVINEHLYIA